jgi:hypothetical protein
MVLDDEVEEVGSARLCARVERLNPEGLLYGGRAPRPGCRPAPARRGPPLAARREVVSQTDRSRSGVVERERRSGRNRPCRGPRKAILVVLQQELPGSRVLRHDLEHGAAFVGDRMARERPGQEPERLLDLTEPPLAQAPLVQRVRL